MQFLPLLDGGGLVQVLVLVFEQPLLHSLQFPQAVHPPATKKKNKELLALTLSEQSAFYITEG